MPAGLHVHAALACLVPLACLAPLAAVAEVTAPNPAPCADLALAVVATPKGRDLTTVTLRVANRGPGDVAGARGDAWVAHVVTIPGQEVEPKKQGFTAIPAGGKQEFTVTRSAAQGDFGVWALIRFGPKLVPGTQGLTLDCNTANNSAVTPVAF